jgi:DNA-binding transcriptional MocR family regulator
LRAGVRDLRIGVPDPALLPDVAAVLASVEVDRELVDGGGGAEPELLKAGAKRFRADGIDAGHMAVVGGALDGVERVLATHVGPGDLVAVEDPSYPPILDLLAAMGATLVPVAVDDEGMQPDSLREALARRPRAIVTVPRAQNPIGAVTSTERAEVLRGLLQREEGLLVVEDDHAHDIVDAPFHALSLGMERRATIRSVSKSLDPDLRLAVVAGDEVTISRLEGRQAVGTGWVSTILQRAVLSLWSDPATAALISRARATYRERREALRDALAERGIASHGQSGLNVWVPVRDEAAIVASLLDAGWAVRAGEHFRIRSGPGIRITTASLLPDEAVELASAIATSSHAALEARRMY